MKSMDKLLKAFSTANSKMGDAIRRGLKMSPPGVKKRNNLIEMLEQSKKPIQVTIKGKVPAARPVDKDVADVASVLGAKHGTDIVWKYNDEQFVTFQSLENIVMNNPLFYVKYAMNNLSEEERGKYPMFFHPCKVAYSELASANIYTPIKVFVQEGQDIGSYGLLVKIGDVYGMLVIHHDDGELIIRESAGFEIDWDEYPEYADVQFMRYSPEAVAAMGIAEEPVCDNDVTVVVNFNK